MPYIGLDTAKPDAVAQNVTQSWQSMRDNMRALRDMVVAGFAPGWGMAPSGGTPEQPAQVLYSNGLERLRVALTWGATGGASGNVTQAAYAYSADSGTTYSTIGTRTLSYDSAGNCTGITWS